MPWTRRQSPREEVASLRTRPAPVPEIGTAVSLAVIAGVLAVTTLASLLVGWRVPGPIPRCTVAVER